MNTEIDLIHNVLAFNGDEILYFHSSGGFLKYPRVDMLRWKTQYHLHNFPLTVTYISFEKALEEACNIKKEEVFHIAFKAINQKLANAPIPHDNGFSHLMESIDSLHQKLNYIKNKNTDHDADKIDSLKNILTHQKISLNFLNSSQSLLADKIEAVINEINNEVIQYNEEFLANLQEQQKQHLLFLKNKFAVNPHSLLL